MFTAAGFHLSALVDLEILPEIDRVNEMLEELRQVFFYFFLKNLDNSLDFGNT